MNISDLIKMKNYDAAALRFIEYDQTSAGADLLASMLRQAHAQGRLEVTTERAREAGALS